MRNRADGSTTTPIYWFKSFRKTNFFFFFFMNDILKIPLYTKKKKNLIKFKISTYSFIYKLLKIFSMFLEKKKPV